MGPKKSNALKDRLDLTLQKAEMEQIRDDVFPQYLVDEDIEPKEQSITKPLVKDIVDRMALVNPDWVGMPPIKEIWEANAIQHLKDHLRHQKRDDCGPLLKKMKVIREAARAKATRMIRECQLRKVRQMSRLRSKSNPKLKLQLTIDW